MTHYEFIPEWTNARFTQGAMTEFHFKSEREAEDWLYQYTQERGTDYCADLMRVTTNEDGDIIRVALVDKIVATYERSDFEPVMIEQGRYYA